ncbi:MULTISPECIES: PRC-barrel domain-containing protein [Haloferacaceae]|uniref:PRC-barrel domain-containing protein n=1 Tax=Halorubrum glutamatedens TaxID=2707018 RepID=A0ABD5QW32_9EURY|nr:PRC-barrel domain-containing protein [Halobellus captivus]
MNAAPEEITSLVGREVYSNNGVFVGEVEDVRLDLDTQSVTGLALAELNHELFAGRVDGNTGVIVPYRWVRAVGDVVLINDIIERLETGTDEPEVETEQQAT